ncbi:MAG: ATPase subunit of ABC transporter with duplicated ATPase domains [Myxococcota bacterium]
MATRVWDIGNGEVIDYPGTFAEYLAQKEAIALAEAPTDKPARGKQKPNKKLAKAEAKRQVKTEVKTEARPASDSEPPAEEEGRRKRKKRKRNRGGGAGPALDDEQHRHLQERIDELKVGMKELEAELADPNLFNDRVGFDKVLAQFTERQKKHEQLSARLTGTSEPERSEPEPPPREDNVRRGTLKRRKKH